jgi:hypothetical protein
MHELPPNYHETHDPEISAEIYGLGCQLNQLDY